MKNKLSLAIVLTVIGLTVKAQADTSQIAKSAIEEFGYILTSGNNQKFPKYLYYDMSEYKGRFLEVMHDESEWKKMITKRDGGYIRILAPGVEWDLVEDKRYPWGDNEVMVKNTVDEYYTNTFKNVKFDKYEYELIFDNEDQDRSSEVYTLFKDGKKYLVIYVSWRGDVLSSVSHHYKY